MGGSSASQVSDRIAGGCVVLRIGRPRKARTWLQMARMIREREVAGPDDGHSGHRRPSPQQVAQTGAASCNSDVTPVPATGRRERVAP
jgi:hypothetical protein